MATKLENAQEVLRKATEEAQAVINAAAKKEHDEERAKRDEKAAQEQIEHEKVMFDQSNVMIDRIEAAVGKQGLKDPRLPIVVFWLMMQGRDGLGRNTPEAGLGALEAYYRTADRLDKAAKK